MSGALTGGERNGMVYGLNIVSANEFLYAAEPLDGNIAAIRAVNQEPDGGVSFKGASSGRRCHTEEFPTRMLWKGPRGSIAGDFNRQNLVNISGKAKAFIEKWEPNAHQFIPFDLVDAKDAVLEKRFFWIVCNRIDSIDREHSTFVLRLGKSWASATDLVRWGESDKIPPNIDRDKPGKFVFNLSRIGQAHAWRDKHMDGGGIWISNDFGDAIKASDLTGVAIPDAGMEAI